MGVEAIPDQAFWALNARSIHSKKEERLALTSEEDTSRNLTKRWFSNRQLSVGFGTVRRGVQSLGWAPLPQALRATVLAPEPPAQTVFTVSPQVAHHCRAIPEMEAARPAAQRPVGFRHHFTNGSPQGPVIEEASQRLPHCGSAFGIGFHMQVIPASA